MVFAILLIAALGTAVTTVGLRGRRTDDHPLCRRCRFDLTGRPTDADRRCPECGADLSPPRAMVVGHRARRRMPLAAGVALLAVAAPAGGVLAWGAANHVNWLRYAPLAYLTREAASPDPARRRPAWAELVARRNAGSLSPAARDRVADVALAYQADSAKPWDTTVGDWLDAARAAGQLSDDRWKRYAAAAWPAARSLRVRPRVRAGDPIPYWVDEAAARVGAGSALLLELRTDDVTPDGLPADPDAAGSTVSTSLAGRGGSSGSAVEPDAYSGRLAVGRHALRLRTPVRVLDGADAAAAAVATGTLDLSAPFDLLPADRPTVQTVHDPSLADRVRAALTVAVHPQQPGGRTGVYVHVDHAPVGLGFTVFLRSPGRPDARMGTVACPAGTAGSSYGTGSHVLTTLGSTVDVVLRGDPAAAAGTTDTFEAWDGELVFKAVPVR